MLQTIQEETATNIYLPSPLQGIIGVDMNQSPANGSPSGQTNKTNTSTIWITGEFFGVQRARDMLFQMSLTKVRRESDLRRRVLPLTSGGQSKQLISRDSAILPRKMDWMVTERAEDLKTLMHDNATFIQFPPIGSSTSLITVIGDNRVNVQRTIRSIMQLVRYPLAAW